MSLSDLDEIAEKRICAGCVGEAYLRAEIERSKEQAACSYCEAHGSTISIDALSQWVEGAFERHYDRTANEPEAWEHAMLADGESSYVFSRKGEPVVGAIADAAVVDEDVAAEIQALLAERHRDSDAASAGEEAEFDDDSYYAEKPTNDREWRDTWAYFEKALKTEARFFSRTAAGSLSSLFNGLEGLAAHDGRPLVVGAGPGAALEVLYRARVFQSVGPLEVAMARPDLNLGPPPSALAVAGRMNAAGISVFYGADTEEAAVAEVRPPVGAKVLVGKFELLRPLRLLDLTALAEVVIEGSVFDPSFAFALERASFLRSLSRRMARAVMPDDAAFEYLSTQAVADFLATEAASPLDGIIFPSAQLATSAKNVVLFHKSSRVEVISLAKGVEVTASTGRWEPAEDEEYWEPDYEVTEQVPPARLSPERPDDDHEGVDFGRFLWPPSAIDPDDRAVALRVAVNDLTVHEIRGISYSKKSHSVRRVRPATIVRRLADP